MIADKRVTIREDNCCFNEGRAIATIRIKILKKIITYFLSANLLKKLPVVLGRFITTSTLILLQLEKNIVHSVQSLGIFIRRANLLLILILK